MTQIARERFPDVFPGEEALAALAARVLVYNPRSSQDLLNVLGQVGVLCMLRLLCTLGANVALVAGTSLGGRWEGVQDCRTMCSINNLRCCCRRCR